MLDKKKFILLKLGYVVMLLVGAFLTYLSSPGLLSFDPLYKLGQVFGTWTLTLYVVQFILSSRVGIIEKGIGLNNLLRFHIYNAILLLTFALLHPLALVTSKALSKLPLFELGNIYGPYYYVGVFTLIFFIGTVLVSTLYKKLGFDYNKWKKIHSLAYLVIPLGFVHSFFTGSDILTRGHLFYWWLILAITALYAVYVRFYERASRTFRYEVSEVIPETKNVFTIKLKPIGKRLVHNAGQFAFVRFFSSEVSNEEHPFTIASAPNSEILCFSIKRSGNFTGTINKLKPGDKAKIEGPYGVFSTNKLEGPFVFIAGGIGITPFMSMLRNMSDKKMEFSTKLIYANRTAADMAFYEELTTLSKNIPQFSFVNVFSEETASTAYKGYITEDIISKEAGNVLHNAKFFICGPSPMMRSVEEVLQNMGVQKTQIFMEKFSLR